MENVTSSRWLDLMERALIVRTLAAPENKAIGAMVWGDTEDRMLEYMFGGLSADGVQNRTAIDGHFQAMGRFLVRPLARKREDALKRFHLGASGRYGKRDPDFINYDAPSMTTPGGYAYWSSQYGSGEEQTAVIPSGRQAVVTAEGYLPFERWDVRSEFVWTYQQRREALTSDRSASLRGGLLDGYGIYVQLSLWLAGTPRISGNPGSMYGLVKYPNGLGPQSPYGLQLVLRGEAVRLHYDGNSRFGSPSSLDAETNRIRVNDYQTCLNLWVTKHIRLTAEYSLYQFPGNPLVTNQAVAPGVKAHASPGSHFLHEISFRVGLVI
jgi:phosphate-selective porin